MFKITITSQKHGIVSREFSSLVELETYVAAITLNEHWGRNSYVRTVTPEVPGELDSEGNILSEPIPAVTEQVPAEWSYVVEDITSKVQEQDEFKESLELIKKGEKILARIVARNRKKVGLTQAQVIQLNNTFAGIQGLLGSGSLPTAKGIISGLAPDGALLTQQDKDAIIQFFVDEGI